jgi:hypothetical protein
MSNEEYWEQHEEAVHEIHEQVVSKHHDLECDCPDCVAAWNHLAELQDNQPVELQSALGGE